MLIMVTSWFPPTKITEAAEKYVEVVQKIPLESFEKPLVTAASKPDKDGIVIIDIVEVTRGKYEEALILIARRMVMFYGIEGFRYQLETLATMEEAMPLIGLAPP